MAPASLRRPGRPGEIGGPPGPADRSAGPGPGLAARLWDVSEQLTAVHFPLRPAAEPAGVKHRPRG